MTSNICPDWDRYMQMPLNISLARERAIGINFQEAAFQVSTALHEATHIYFAVFGGATLLGGTINPGNSANKSIEHGGIEWDCSQASRYTEILSLVSADVFEYCANGFSVSHYSESDMCRAYIYSKYLPLTAEAGDYLPKSALESHGKAMTDEQISETLSEAAQIVISAFSSPDTWKTIRATAIYLLKFRRIEDGFISADQLHALREFVLMQQTIMRNGNTVEPSNAPTFRDDISWLLRAFGKWPHSPISMTESMSKYFEDRLAPQSIKRLNALDTQSETNLQETPI